MLRSVCLVCLRRGHLSGQCGKDNFAKWSACRPLAGLTSEDGLLGYNVRKADFVRNLREQLGEDLQRWVAVN
jgi:hypothetical protein